MKRAVAGTMESNDCMIFVEEATNLIIEIESIVLKQFGTEIRNVIENTLKEINIEHIHLKCVDKGALNYTIRSRVKTAIERMNR